MQDSKNWIALAVAIITTIGLIVKAWLDRKRTIININRDESPRSFPKPSSFDLEWVTKYSRVFDSTPVKPSRAPWVIALIVIVVASIASCAGFGAIVEQPHPPGQEGPFSFVLFYIYLFLVAAGCVCAVQINELSPNKEATKDVVKGYLILTVFVAIIVANIMAAIVN